MGWEGTLSHLVNAGDLWVVVVCIHLADVAVQALAVGGTWDLQHNATNYPIHTVVICMLLLFVF